MRARRAAAITAAAGAALALAGCSSSAPEASAPSMSPVAVASSAPSPSPSASREAKLAVTRCTEAMSAIGTPLATYLDSETANAEGQEWAHGLLEDAVTEAGDACDEAVTQLGVDGMSDQALAISERLASGDMIALRLAVHLGGFEWREGLDEAAEYFGLFGPVWDWSNDLKQSVGM